MTGDNKPEEKRKRGLFSCDRCKVKKIACYRTAENGGIYDPCVTCQALNIDCETTIKRKKRKLFMDAAISQTNHNYMVKILTSIYPDLDCSNPAQLAELWKAIESKEDKPQEKEMETEPSSYVVYSGKSFNGIESTLASFGKSLASYDRVIYDNDGISHYLGSFGFTSVLTILINNIIIVGDQKNPNSIQFVKSMNKRGSIISSFSETIHPENFGGPDSNLFPWVCYFTKDECEFYVDRFYHYSHRLLSVIDEEEFKVISNTFWRIEADNLPATTLSNAQYCCIYTVWIIGMSMEIYPNLSMQVTYELMNRYINLIKLLLSDIFLIPSADGIRCLLLLSNFFERNMQLETAYILCQSAVCHAMSCGYHRESVSSDETFHVWWSLFDREIKLGLYLGRSSTIPLKQVNLNYRKKFGSQDLDLLMVEMNRVGYHFLCNRTKLPLAPEELNESHISSALGIQESFENVYSELSQRQIDLFEIAEALLNYYWLSISSNLPFVLYPIKESTIFKTQSKNIIKLVESCVSTSIDAVKLILKLEELECQDPLDLFEASISTYIMAVFVGATLFYKTYPNKIPNENDITNRLEEINTFSHELREYNQQRLSVSRGTVRIRRYWVEVLNQDLDSINLKPTSPAAEKLHQIIFESDSDTKGELKDAMPVDQASYLSPFPRNLTNMFDIDGIFEHFFNNDLYADANM